MEPKTLYFNFDWLLQDRFLVSRTVSQLIMRVRKPKVEYKLALQEKPEGSILTYYYKTI